MNKKLIKNAITSAKAGLLVLACVSIAIAQNKPDELKQRILVQAQSMGPDDYAFTRTVKSDQTSNGKTEHHVNVEKYDPTKPVDAKWTLVSVDGAAPAADVLTKYKQESPKRPVPGYYRLAKYFGGAATTSTDAKGRAVFHFNSLSKDSVLVMGSDVSSNSGAEVTVADVDGKPFAEQVHLTVRPTRIKLVMKLDRYESTARYRIGPDGKPLLIEQTSDMSGSGMGQEGQVRNTISYSDYRAIR